GVLGHLAVIQVGRQRREALGRQLITHTRDVGIEAPPLLDNDHARACALLGRGQVAAGLVPVAGELDALTHAHEGETYPPIFRWSHETTSSTSMRTATRLATMKLMYSSPWSGPNPVSYRSNRLRAIVRSGSWSSRIVPVPMSSTPRRFSYLLPSSMRQVMRGSRRRFRTFCDFR